MLRTRFSRAACCTYSLCISGLSRKDSTISMICLLKAFPKGRCAIVSQNAFPAVIGYWAAEAKTVSGVALGRRRPNRTARDGESCEGHDSKGRAHLSMLSRRVPIARGKNGHRTGAVRHKREFLACYAYSKTLRVWIIQRSRLRRCFLAGHSPPVRTLHVVKVFWAACKNHTHSA